MDLSRFSLEGRTAIITGGTGGIGLGTAKAMAQAGANIVIAGVPPEQLDGAVAEVKALGVDAIGVKCDVSNKAEVTDMVAQAASHFGRIDILANVAGGSYSRNPYTGEFKRYPLLEISEEDFMGAFEVNVKGTMLCAQAVVPHMRKVGKGAIINIGSSSGLDNEPRGPIYAAYGSAKAAVHRMTVYMAYEWAPQVRVNCIAPGLVDTPRPAGESRPNMAEGAARLPVGRVGVPDDIASVALFLASDASSFVTGALIRATGGE
jgi:NAD(P)-dependent dehydrogenase (short-subunit alcohol dehydrogenase family)